MYTYVHTSFIYINHHSPSLYFPAHPNSIAYIGPSVSPYYDLNPGYRIYYVINQKYSHNTMLINVCLSGGW